MITIINNKPCLLNYIPCKRLVWTDPANLFKLKTPAAMSWHLKTQLFR